MAKAEKERKRQSVQKSLRKLRAKEYKDRPDHRRVLSDLLGENVGMGFTPRAKQQGEIERILGTNKPKKKRGGTVKRKRGGKIMQGYKAGGKV